ncbi:MAG: hypothetical protein IK093_11905 [Ruminiclostridium sp.]|nr:hypothetical protein [Ruminiclostridium sp.]
MNEIDIMKRAQQYIESLSRGIDPLSGQPVPENDVVRSERIARCLSYSAGVLQKVIEAGGVVRRKKSELADFYITPEQAESLVPLEGMPGISKVAVAINALIDEGAVKKLKSVTINNWLIKEGLLYEVEVNGKSKKLPTDAGAALGIVSKECVNANGIRYTMCVFPEDAQQYIFDRIADIAEFAAAEDSRSDVPPPVSDAGSAVTGSIPPPVPQGEYIAPKTGSVVVNNADIPDDE